MWAAYIQKAEHLDERKLMLQWWADFLDANSNGVVSRLSLRTGNSNHYPFSPFMVVGAFFGQYSSKQMGYILQEGSPYRAKIRIYRTDFIFSFTHTVISCSNIIAPFLSFDGPQKLSVK